MKIKKSSFQRNFYVTEQQKHHVRTTRQIYFQAANSM